MGLMRAFCPNRIAVHLTRASLRAVRRGHPWVYDRGIERQNRGGSAGDLAVLFDGNRRFVGVGLYDPESPIRVRVLHHGEQTLIDAMWLRNRLADACRLRSELREDAGTTAYRLVHGENDGLGGLVVDRYDRTLVIKLDTGAWVPHLAVLVDMVTELPGVERVVLRLSRTVSDSATLPDGIFDGCILYGPACDGPVVFLENGLRFEADPVFGQKTGFFLDQRDNRARLERVAGGREVLNVFSYTGGFSVYAARGGARLVVSLDLSHPALLSADRNMALNRSFPGVSSAMHETVCADAFDGLSRMVSRGRRFGLVVLDPPSFARRQSDVGRAVSAYERLVGLGLGVLRPGGILVAASCSARVSADAFYGAVERAAFQVGRQLAVMEKTAHALDHPIGFAEGAYLKCLFARA